MVRGTGTISTDVLIIGAGTAGCVLAARLSEDPSRRVTLVEAGGRVEDPEMRQPLMWPLLQGRDYDWAFVTEPQSGTANRRHPWPRGKGLGGSTLLHAMAHVRGHPSDFEAWVAAGCTGWGFKDLLPHFQRSEDNALGAGPWHGEAGPIAVAQLERPHELVTAFRAAAEAEGLAPTAEHNGPSMLGPTLNSLTLVEGQRQTIADAYLEPVLGRPNLTLVTGRQALRLLFAPGPRVTGVELATASGIERLEAPQVILCAGAVGTPWLLMLSGLGPAESLRQAGVVPLLDLPGVGENLHDHLLSGGNLYKARQKVAPSRYQHSESLLYIDSSGDEGPPDIAIACVVAPVVTECFAAPPLGEAFTFMFGFTQPRSRGRLRLASNDPATPPRIDPAYLSDPADQEAYLRALSWAQRIGANSALSDWNGGELLPGPEVKTRDERLAFLERAAFTHHHPVGTCAMGPGPQAVVDPVTLGVKGVAGLQVVDASILPRITCGPINAAVVAVAERASEILVAQA